MQCWSLRGVRPDSGLPPPPIIQCDGIWDTGARGSVITKQVIDQLGLQSIDRIPVETANGVRESNVYLVNIHLPSAVGFKALRVTEGDLLGADVLIGMDIIGLGDFSITHEAGDRLVMSYRTPPEFDRTIDFVKEINSRKAMEQNRNERLRSKKGKRSKSRSPRGRRK